MSLMSKNSIIELRRQEAAGCRFLEKNFLK